MIKLRLIPIPPLFVIKTYLQNASKTFTHIVVGARSADCIVPARIAENPNFDVLLIEAGPDCNYTSSEVPIGIQDARRVPMKGQLEIFDQQLDWNLVVNLPNSQSMVVPQAKIVGAGSSIDRGTALQNTEADCKEWVQLGNEAWNYESVGKVYKSLEDDKVRRTHGPHPITRTTPDEAGQIQNAFVEGAKSYSFD